MCNKMEVKSNKREQTVKQQQVQDNKGNKIMSSVA